MMQNSLNFVGLINGPNMLTLSSKTMGWTWHHILLYFIHYQWSHDTSFTGVTALMLRLLPSAGCCMNFLESGLFMRNLYSPTEIFLLKH
jgi:hypothetical protein